MTHCVAVELGKVCVLFNICLCNTSRARLTAIQSSFVTLSELKKHTHIFHLPLKMNTRIRTFVIDKSHLHHLALLVELGHLPSKSLVVAVTKKHSWWHAQLFKV